MPTQRRLFREPFNGFSHLAGAGLSVWGLVVLMLAAARSGSSARIIAYAVYGASLIMLYTASSVYHLLLVPEKVTRALRYVDHMMIYFLIAGTYTPICLLVLPGSWGRNILIGIWALAGAGMVTTGLWLNAPRWLSTLIYVLMGWAIIIATPPLLRSLGRAAFAWLLAGGLFYSVGAFIYAAKRPNFAAKILGFHELFHLFILAGSFCHYWLILKYV
jgi:hemolysin III